MLRLALLIVTVALGACAQNVSDTNATGGQAQLNSGQNGSSDISADNKRLMASRGIQSGKKGALLLNSWQQGENKKAITRFVSRSVDRSSNAYLPVDRRIAVLDLDGTLWVEKPQKTMRAFVKQELLRQVNTRPELQRQQPWQSVANGNDSYLEELNFSTAFLSLLKAHSGLTQAAYNHQVKAFFKSYRHPHFNRPQWQLAYQPMQELIHYLQANQYRVYIVDGSENAFIRAFSQTVFNIPTENVIGSSALLIWREGSEKLIRGDEFVAPVNDGDGKPVNIERYIGQRPVIAIGNDDSDIAMLNYVSESKNETLVMVLNHDDSQREFRYRPEKLERLANKKNWLSISIKNDFRRLFQ